FVSATGMAPVGGGAVGLTKSTIGGADPTFGSGLSGLISAGTSVSNAIGLPTGYTLSPNVAAAFAPGSVYGLGAMAIGYGGTGETLTYSTKADFTFDWSSNVDFLLGLDGLNGILPTGTGFLSSELSVYVDGILKLDDLFSSLLSAETFFTDNP